MIYVIVSAMKLVVFYVMVSEMVLVMAHVMVSVMKVGMTLVISSVSITRVSKMPELGTLNSKILLCDFSRRSVWVARRYGCAEGSTQRKNQEELHCCQFEVKMLILIFSATVGL